MPVDQFARITANRVLLFVENAVVYAMQRDKGKLPIYVAEIPPQERDPNYPRRFRVLPRGLAAAQPWTIQYAESFDFV